MQHSVEQTPRSSDFVGDLGVFLTEFGLLETHLEGWARNARFRFDF